MNSRKGTRGNFNKKQNERGAALAVAVILLAIMSVIAMTALAFSSTEARIAGSDLQRTQTFYAASAGMEKMTNDFSNLFNKKLHPTTADLNNIAADYPVPLNSEGFDFSNSQRRYKAFTRASDHPEFTEQLLPERQYFRRTFFRALCQRRSLQNDFDGDDESDTDSGKAGARI